MNILIVDDGKDKRHNIRHVIECLDNVETDAARSYFSAKNKLFHGKKNYDLAVIDMFLPDARDDDEIRGLAGKDLVFDMRDRGLEIPVIVVTQYTDYGDNYYESKKNSDCVPSFLENSRYGQPRPEFRTKEYDCTYYEGLHQYLMDEIPYYLGIIYYSNQHRDWENKLLYLINKVKK